MLLPTGSADEIGAGCLVRIPASCKHGSDELLHLHAAEQHHLEAQTDARAAKHQGFQTRQCCQSEPARDLTVDVC